jgi:hypothetical protein
MNPRVKAVRPNPDYTLTIVFDNGETRRFDVTPYLEKGIFRELRDLKNFNSVKAFLGSVQWRGGQDLCPDTLYMDSKPISESLDSGAGSSEGTAIGVAESPADFDRHE